MSPIEKVVDEVANKLINTGKLSYEKEVVPIEDWINDFYYCGELAEILWDPVKQDIITSFKGNYTEIIFTGALAIGKSLSAITVIMRMLYELSCYTEPQEVMGLPSHSEMVMVFLSVSYMKARDVLFRRIKRIIEATPYFRTEYAFDPRYTIELRFPKNIVVKPAIASEKAILSEDIIAAVMDESNFLPIVEKSKRTPGREVFDQAEVIYEALRRRMESRFLKQGKLPCKIILASSKQYPDDFIERRILEIEQGLRKNSIYFSRSIWDAKPKGTFSDETFKIEIGDEARVSRILKEGDEPRGRVIEVPIDFRESAEKDLEGFLRDSAGVAVLGISPLITDREKIFDCIRKNDGSWEEFQLRHPYSKIETTLRDQAFLIEEFLVKKENGAYKPLVRPNAVRFVHIDPSLRQDALGFAMGHVEKLEFVKRQLPSGEKKEELVPKIYIDFLLRVIPPFGGEIILDDVRQLIYELTRLGFKIAYVSLDTFQSSDTIQILQSNGYHAGRLSVDKKLDPYMQLRSAIYDKRISFYEYEPLLVELQQLIYYKASARVDHRPTGSKDVSDALAGVVYHCNTLADKFSSEPLNIEARYF
jgi:hypothetical protein